MAHALTGRDKISAGAIPEVVEHTIPVSLQHLRVNVEARVAQLRHFLREELHSAAETHHARTQEVGCDPRRRLGGRTDSHPRWEDYIPYTRFILYTLYAVGGPDWAPLHGENFIPYTRFILYTPLHGENRHARLLTELQKMIDWLMANFANSVFKQWTF